MKHILFITASVLLISLASIGYGKDEAVQPASTPGTTVAGTGTTELAVMTPAEKAAVAKFNAELLAAKSELEALMKEGKEAAAANPLAGLVPLKALCNRVQLIKADGVPTELAEAWKGMAGSFAKMAEIFKDFPDKPGDMSAWIVKNVGSDRVALQKWAGDLQSNIQTVTKAGNAAVKHYDETALKYGIDPNLMK